MIDHDKQEFLWCQKYRPQKVEDCILPESLKTTFLDFAKQDRLPSLLLTGSSGTGKTTVARALCNETGSDWMLINASNDNGIDVLRTRINQYASTVSLTGAKKVVILDEADSLTPAAQTALRAFVEDVSKNATFILTANYKNRIIPALQSRFTPIDFQIKTAEKPKLAAEFMRRAFKILNEEKVEYDRKVVAEIISRHFPDFRRILNELQRYSSNGKIDTGIFANLEQESIAELVKALKAKQFGTVRKWVAMNADIDTAKLFRDLYDGASENVEPRSIPELILILAKYQYQDAFVVDKEINTMAALCEVMRDVHWK